MRHTTNITVPAPACDLLPDSHTPQFIFNNLPDSLFSLIQLIVHHIKGIQPTT